MNIKVKNKIFQKNKIYKNRIKKFFYKEEIKIYKVMNFRTFKKFNVNKIK
jgi:hypothetical protein